MFLRLTSERDGHTALINLDRVASMHAHQEGTVLWSEMHQGEAMYVRESLDAIEQMIEVRTL